jgi:hypothetical protein
VPWGLQKEAIAHDWWLAHRGYLRAFGDSHANTSEVVLSAIMVAATAYVTVRSILRPRLAWAWVLYPLYVFWFWAGLPVVWRT